MPLVGGVNSDWLDGSSLSSQRRRGSSCVHLICAYLIIATLRRSVHCARLSTACECSHIAASFSLLWGIRRQSGTMRSVMTTSKIQTWGVTAPAMMLVAVMLALFPASAYAQETDSSSGLSTESLHILNALNAERSAAGLGPLTPNSLLNRAAQVHADDILTNYNYSHWGTDGTLAKDRVIRTGYSNSPWVSENWVASRSPEAAMTWWMNDYIHRVNILTPRWVEVGIGTAVRAETGEMVFVTVFSAGRDSAAQAEPVASASALPAGQNTNAGGDVASSAAAPLVDGKYVVQQGDTLLGIALRYQYDWNEVAAVNGLSEDSLLQIGQILLMPDASSGIGGPNTEPFSGPTVPYVVRPGETLVAIAGRHGTTWEELARINGLTENSLLQIGQTIQTPAVGVAADVSSSQKDSPTVESDGEPSELKAEIPATHIVAAGDTIVGIALAYGLDWLDLLELNALSEDTVLQLGQIIRLR